MIKPEDFYSESDVLSNEKKQSMWAKIRKHAPSLNAGPIMLRDRRSFVLGMAASLVLGLALYGGWVIALQAFENAKPGPIRYEQAYVSAIREFERIVPSVNVSNGQVPLAKGQLTQRREQLRLIDEAIADLRRQTNGADLSPLKRERLRQLYSVKLQVLQQMIEEGEIEI